MSPPDAVIVSLIVYFTLHPAINSFITHQTFSHIKQPDKRSCSYDFSFLYSFI
ncbi:hypothetical protein B4144_3826 [Bacillus atrophaeus]|nr:hypothetical protein B4144_3826 [Bacillus atrophaeus]